MNRIKNIDSIRFIFSILIVYYHIFYFNIFKAGEIGQVYSDMAARCPDLRLVVEFFFIIAGFFLYKTRKEKENLSLKTFASEKFARLYGVYAFCILLNIVWMCFRAPEYSINSFISAFLDLLMLKCTGLKDFIGIDWFVAPYFISMVLYFYILKNFKNSNFIIALITYFSALILVNSFFGNFSRDMAFIFQGGLLMALFGIGLGYFTGLFYYNCKLNVKGVIIPTLVELASAYFLIDNMMIHNRNIKDKIVYPVVFSIFFLSLLYNKGIISKLLNNGILAYFGRFSYSIYLIQTACFGVFAATIWKNQTIISNPVLCISLSLILCTLSGILTFYLIEIPSKNFIKEKLNQI